MNIESTELKYPAMVVKWKDSGIEVDFFRAEALPDSQLVLAGEAALRQLQRVRMYAIRSRGEKN